MKIRIVTILTLGLFLFGCANNTADESEEEQGAQMSDTHQHDEETESLELNNGEKWKVDETMMTFIRNMETDIMAFQPNQLEDYRSLAHKLHENINLLTSNCTMTGIAHDQLHIWLVPYITEVNKLSKAENNIDAGKSFIKIKESFAMFNKYFQ